MKTQEVTYQPLYHYRSGNRKGDLAGKRFDFFNVPVGVQGYTFLDTNMFIPNRLPRPVEYMITGVRVVAQFSDPDVYMRVLSDSNLELMLGSKAYLRDGPLYKFPTMFPVPLSFTIPQLFPDANQHIEALKAYEEKVKHAYYAITPLRIVADQNFGVTIMLADEIDGGRLGVILDGFAYRPVY